MGFGFVSVSVGLRQWLWLRCGAHNIRTWEEAESATYSSRAMPVIVKALAFGVLVVGWWVG